MRNILIMADVGQNSDWSPAVKGLAVLVIVAIIVTLLFGGGGGNDRS